MQKKRTRWMDLGSDNDLDNMSGFEKISMVTANGKSQIEIVFHNFRF